MSQFNDFVHKWEKSIKGTTLTISVGATRQPAPYESLRAERSMSVEVLGRNLEHAGQIADDLQQALLADMQTQLSELYSAIYESKE